MQRQQARRARKWLPQLQEEQTPPHQGLAASRDCDVYDVFLFVEFSKLQVFLVVVSSTCAAAAQTRQHPLGFKRQCVACLAHQPRPLLGHSAPQFQLRRPTSPESEERRIRHLHNKLTNHDDNRHSNPDGNTLDPLALLALLLECCAKHSGHLQEAGSTHPHARA
jgi:hypothetical protein